MRRTYEQAKNSDGLTPVDIAAIYGQQFKAIKQRQAEDLYLAPFGLNADTLLTHGREYSDRIVDRLADQMQQYEGADVEALVVGGDGVRTQIIHVDHRGRTTDHSAIGFATIGIGSWHARSRLMQSGYVNIVGYSKALTETFAAKKAAETAPGVGNITDAVLVTKDECAPIGEDILGKTLEIHESKVRQVADIELNSVEQMQSHIDNLVKDRDKQYQDGVTYESKSDVA